MKIIASDFDGTLNYQGKVSEEDKIAITKFQKSGGKFGIVTGRDLELTIWVYRDSGVKLDFVICCTGAVITDENGDIIYKKTGKVTDRMQDVIEKAGFYNARSFTVSDGIFKCSIDLHHFIKTDLSRMPEFTHCNVWFPKEEDAEKFARYMQKNHSEYISAHRNGTSVDMPPAITSKVSGIKEYASRFENPEIYTVGDNSNDIGMIKEFKGFAVSNAVDELKEIALYKCDRIADMIEKIMNGEAK